MSQHEKRLILIETPRGHLEISDFWLELLAGRPLLLDWTANDLGAELEAEHEELRRLEETDLDVTMRPWCNQTEAQRQRFMDLAYA